MLSGLGYQIRIAENGREALDAALQGDVDLIFMDVQMPVMDGIEATKQIVAAMPRDKRPLIVAMTANAMESDRKRCIEAGMDTFISKPFLMNELVRMLKTVPAMRVGKVPDHPEISLEPASEPTNGLPATEIASTQPAEPESGAPTKLTDMTMLEAVSNGEPAFVLGILGKLVIKLPEAVEELRVAIEKADWETVRATSHRNKSSAAYTGSDELKNKFMELEHMARDLHHLEEMPMKIEELHRFVTAVVMELKAHISERTQ
jgi:CheY-like chemotaxis protein